MAALTHSTPVSITPPTAVLARRIVDALADREQIESLVDSLIAMLDGEDAPGEDREIDDEDACAVEDAPILVSRHQPSDETDDEDGADDEPSVDAASWMVWRGAREATPVSSLFRRT